MFARMLIVVIAAVVLWAGLARSSDASGPERRYVVRTADTLWSIAATRYADPREGVYEIRRRNGLEETMIRPGQVLIVP